jgi:O-antigen/teichoic acid export membrane protein
MNAQLLRDALWVLATRLTNRGSNFLTFLLVARSLSVEAFGLYGYVVATTLVLSVACDMGLRQAAAQRMGADPGAAPAVATHLALLWLPLAVIAGAGSVLALRWGDLAASPDEQGLVAGAAAALLLIRMGQGIFLGQGNIRALNQSELVSRAVMLGGTVGFWALGRLDLGVALWLLFVAHAVAAAWLAWQLRSLLAPAALPDPALLRRLLRSGLLFASGVVLIILMGRVGIWVVNARLDPAALGAYFGVLRVSEMIVEVATAVGVVLFSHGVRSAALDATAQAAAAREAARVARIALLVMAVGAAGLAAVAGPFLQLLLGAPFGEQATAFRVLLLGTLPACLTNMLFPTLTAHGHARFGALVLGPGVLANGGLTWILSAPFGVTGACAAVAIANLLVAAILLAVLRRQLGLGVGEVLLIRREDLRQILQAARRRLARGLSRR